MSFTNIDVFGDELERVKKIAYEISADIFNIQAITPTPPQYFGIENESAIIAEEEHELRITYPQVFINGRPVSGSKRIRVTIELLDGDSE